MTERFINWRPRTTLSNLLLLTAAVAVMLASHRTHDELEQTKASVRNMRSLSRQLIIDDPGKIAAVSRLPTLPNELIIDVHVPSQSTNADPLELRLALEGIMEYGTTEKRFPKPLRRFPISPGRHSVEIRHQKADVSDPESQHEIAILLDGKIVIQESRPPSWMPSNGWSSTSSLNKSHTFDAYEPAELHRRRFNQPTGGGGSRSAPV
jgi:hypothetical protein